MDFNYTEEQKAFQREVKAFLDAEVSPDLVAESESGLGWGPESWKFIKKLGKKGWLTLTWPKKWGGLGASNVDRLILFDELEFRRVPHSFLGASIAGPVILMFGNDEQKARYLPKIARGEIEFALGYTEPEAGSDVAALQLRATEEPDCYVLNGQKIFNTYCHFAQYHWLGARTDPNAPKHKGVSLFVVPLDLPGITIQPLYCMDGERTNAVFYENVRIPKTSLVGQKNRGFYQIAVALDFERMSTTGGLSRSFAGIVEYVKETSRDGRKLCEDVGIQRQLGRMAADIEIAKLLSYRVALMLDKGVVASAESSMVNLWVKELIQKLGNLGMTLQGPYQQIAPASADALLGGDCQGLYYYGFRRKITGGTAEIQRNVIATRGLGLPKD